MIRIGALVLNVADLRQAAGFWSAALTYEVGDNNPDFLRPPNGAGGVRLHLDDCDHTHLDLWTDSEQEQQAEVERLVSLGARRVEWDYPAEADFIVLADPAGNRFCVINTSA